MNLNNSVILKHQRVTGLIDLLEFLNKLPPVDLYAYDAK